MTTGVNMDPFFMNPLFFNNGLFAVTCDASILDKLDCKSAQDCEE